jgi:protein TonB
VAAAAPLPAAKPAPPIGGKLEQAQLITRVPPTYPAAARQRAIVGEVRLIAEIDERGNVKNVKILTGNAALSAAAKSAVMLWKYRPATLNGQPISTTSEITIVFKER